MPAKKVGMFERVKGLRGLLFKQKTQVQQAASHSTCNSTTHTHLHHGTVTVHSEDYSSLSIRWGECVQ
jgi:hypothetical protein